MEREEETRQVMRAKNEVNDDDNDYETDRQIQIQTQRLLRQDIEKEMKPTSTFLYSKFVK